MPIIKHRDNFSEILSRAASHKVVNTNRTADTLTEIKENATTTSRRLSTKLANGLRSSQSGSGRHFGKLIMSPFFLLCVTFSAKKLSPEDDDMNLLHL